MSDFLKDKLGKMYEYLPEKEDTETEKVPDVSAGDFVAADQQASAVPARPNKVTFEKVNAPYLGELDPNQLRENPRAAALAGGVLGAGLGAMGEKNLYPPGVPEARTALRTATGVIPALTAAEAEARRLFELDRAGAAATFNQPNFWEDFQTRKALEQGYGQPPRTASEIAAQGKFNPSGGTSRGNVQGFGQTTGNMYEGVRNAAPEISKGAFTGTSQGSNPLFLTTDTADEIAAARRAEMANRAIAEQNLERGHAQWLASQRELDAARLDRSKKAGALKEVLPGVAEGVGYKSSAFPKITGALSGASGVTSLIDAIDRYEKGDRSGAVLSTISAGLGGMAALPAAKDPRVLAAKGAGILGSLGMIPVEMAHDYLKPKIMSILEREGLYSPSVMD